MVAPASSDKEMWEMAGFPNHPRYEYVPLPNEVTRMLSGSIKTSC